MKWAADAKAQTPAMGGAAWMVSRHTKNPKLAAQLVTWLTTAPEVWAAQPNYPAYRPIMDLWQKQVSSDPLFASDPYPVMKAAADVITPLDKWPRFDLIGPLTQVVKEAQKNKQTMESVLPKVAEQLAPLAEVQGYIVDVKK